METIILQTFTIDKCLQLYKRYYAVTDSNPINQYNSTENITHPVYCNSIIINMNVYLAKNL